MSRSAPPGATLKHEDRDRVRRQRAHFDSEYYYPARLGPLKRAAGAAFDRLAARSSRARERRAAGR